MEVCLSLIRRATPADMAAMEPLINAAFTIETFLEGTRTDEQRLLDAMNKGQFLLGYDSADDLVASLYLEIHGTRGYFGMLAVSPLHQGKGVGRGMVEAAEAYCRLQGCTAIDLTVLNVRPELLPFYSKLGYAETGTEEFHPSRPLKPGVECYGIVMSKHL